MNDKGNYPLTTLHKSRWLSECIIVGKHTDTLMIIDHKNVFR